MDAIQWSVRPSGPSIPQFLQTGQHFVQCFVGGFHQHVDVRRVALLQGQQGGLSTAATVAATIAAAAAFPPFRFAVPDFTHFQQRLVPQRSDRIVQQCFPDVHRQGRAVFVLVFAAGFGL